LRCPNHTDEPQLSTKPNKISRFITVYPLRMLIGFH
jgi:hypothetical protein